MTSIIRLSDLKWPCSRADLLADNPATWFPARLEDCLPLSEFGYELPSPTSPPSYDPATEYLVETRPILVNGTWAQAWDVQPLPPPPAEPQWAQFSDAIYSNPVARAAMAAAPPLLGIRLGVGLGLARSGQPDDLESFGLAWDDAIAEGLIPPELAAALQQLAEQYQLPQSFIGRLRGSP